MPDVIVRTCRDLDDLVAIYEAIGRQFGDVWGGDDRRLDELVEARALVRGARVIALGAADEARGFYETLGYRGKHAMREKQLPLPGVVRTRLATRAIGELSALESGVPVGS